MKADVSNKLATASDEVLTDAVGHADPLILRGLLYQLTGDTSGDLVVWDTLVLQHARDKLSVTTPRTLRRVVFGERAPWEDWPHAAPSYHAR